ncbi:MAG: hypothetical protein ACUVRD_02180 [Bacteroidia bacterium]
MPLALGLLVWAQQPKTVTGSAVVALLPGWSLQEVQRHAYNQAVWNALVKNFPSQVAQASKLILQNQTQGTEAQTQTFFHLTADQYLAAEWLEDTDIRYRNFVEKNQVYVECKVKGKARALETPPLPLKAQSRRCLDSSCVTTEFLDGDPLYLAFQSPQEGYLQVYMELDSAWVTRLVPYAAQKLAAYPIQAQKTYLLFHPETRSQAFEVDEIQLTADTPVELHRLYVIFSLSPLPQLGGRWDYSQALPRLPVRDFQEHLLELRLKQKIHLRILDLSVRKPTSIHE